MSKVEDRLKELGHEVVDPGAPKFNYVGAVKTGNLVFVAGHGPFKGGEYIFKGKLGQDMDVFDGDGRPLRGEVGELVCKRPWPGMTRAEMTTRSASPRCSGAWPR